MTSRSPRASSTDVRFPHDVWASLTRSPACLKRKVLEKIGDRKVKATIIQHFEDRKGICFIGHFNDYNLRLLLDIFDPFNEYNMRFLRGTDKLLDKREGFCRSMVEKFLARGLWFGALTLLRGDCK